MPLSHRRGAAATLVALAVALAPLAGAAAQTPSPTAATPRPVIDRAPARVAFRSTVVIRGHLDDRAQGREIALERRLAGRDWIVVARAVTDEHGRVSFVRRRQARTASYRLVFQDDLAGTRTASDPARVRVHARLRLRTPRTHVMVGRKASLSGRLYPVAAGRRVIIELRVDGAWRWLRRARVRDGVFRTRIATSRVGRHRVRARFAGDRLNAPARADTRVWVYDPDLSTWYGPGLYGNRMACGGTLTTGTLGVAHKTRPCGSKVSLLYRGRSITVTVVDRGPYSGAEWDLTEATARRIGFYGSGYVGVID